MFVICRHITNGQSECSAIRHGIPRIYGDINDRKFQFRKIDFNGTDAVADVFLVDNISAKGTFDHRPYFLIQAFRSMTVGLRCWRRENVSNCRVRLRRVWQLSVSLRAL